MTKTLSIEKAREFDAFCRARHGLPYAYGGAFTTDPKRSTDCSGLVLQTGAILAGRTDWSGNRYGSTESFRLDYKIVYDLGFKRLPRGGVAALGFTPVMLVGLQHGGGGIYSHTACTLMFIDRPGGKIGVHARGVDWESSGSYGVGYYDRARPWNDSLFHDFWYLDMKLASAAPAVNEIDAEYNRAKGWIGARLDKDEKVCPDGEGRFVRCERGYIYWHPKVNVDKPAGERAIAVPADIFEVWAASGWERGPIGYPTRRHYTDPGIGTIQGFQNGAVYRRYGTKGGIVHGAIGARYSALGAEKTLGYPLGNEETRGDGGRRQRFERGALLWHPSAVVRLLNGEEG